MAELKPIIEQSMKQYAGAVLQSRALVDVRDGLKPSARQIFYSMLLHKLTSDKPYKKTANAVGMAMADFYIHGDSSCEGIIMRAGQSFAMRYPLIDIKGNAGTLIESGNWAAMRYTESRLSKLSDLLFDDIEKDTINEWRDSYDNTKQFPAVLPSKGFYNIVNGTQGIGIGMASSVPQYNLRELNNALIYLIDNPGCDFSDIYCAPDFATGAILYNENEVKESMRNGTGFACKLRSVVEFDAKEQCLIVTEIPYGVYTNTICGELEEIVNGENNPGIERFNDLTGEKPLIKIYLAKKANPDKVLKYLYKETSLQYYYSINFTMLDNGRFPRVFTWKEMLQAHIDHEKEVYRRGFEYDLNKIENRIHIIDGILICLAQINQVVETIKSSASTAAASIALQRDYLLDAEQAKAVLDMKLSRLAHLEVKKLEDERDELTKKADHIKQILSNDELFKEELKNGWREVSKKFGDERRTKIMDLGNYNEDEGEEPVEEKSLIISLTNKNNLYVTETSSLYISRRAAAGNKIKLSSNECFISSISGNTTGESIFITKSGKIYRILNARLPINSLIDLNSLLSTKNYETFINVVSLNNIKQYAYLTIATSNGNIKKTLLNEYNNCRQGAVGIKLKENDEIVSVFLTNNEQIMCMSDDGYSIIFNSSEISPGGKATQGVKAMTLRPGAHLSCAIPLDSTFTQIVFCTEKGKILRTKINEFSIQKRTGKGVISINLDKDDKLIDAALINERASDIILAGDLRIIRFPISSITVQSRGGKGIIGIKTKEITKINKILVE